MGEPDVSIVIPVYNDASTLDRAVESCLSQTCRDLEIIIVDDASDDGTAEIADGYASRNSHVRVIHHPKNLQLLEARRTGIAAATGEWILFLDADDWLDADVCERTLAMAREADADIVQFGIVPEYGQNKPDEETVKRRAMMYAARDLEAEGEDIIHATYRDDKVVWSLCGKLFARGLLKSAFENVPVRQMFHAEDAYLYFVIAWYARRLVSSSRLPDYRYSIGTGGTQTDSHHLSLDAFESICRGSLAVEGVSEFLAEKGCSETFQQDYEYLRLRIVADPASRFPHDIARPLQSEAFDLLCKYWPIGEAIGTLAVIHWAEFDTVLGAADGSLTLRRREAPIKRVGVYYFSMGTGGGERASRDLMKILQDMGYDVVFLCDEPEGESSDLRLPDGVDVVYLPRFSESIGVNYPQRARALEQSLVDNGIDALVYAQWLSPTLPWDLLVTRALGVPFIIHTHDTFLVLGSYDNPEFLNLPAAYHHANAVVCLSEADRQFWGCFNPNVFRTQNPLPKEALAREAASLDGHRVLWVGRIEPDKWPNEAVEVMGQVAPAVPDATLTMVGPADASTLAALRSRIRDLGLEERVIFTGSKTESEMAAVYHEADVFLLTSHYEGWSLVLAEAKSAGLPCVMYDMPFLTLAKEGGGTLKAGAGDIGGLARQVTRLLENEELRRMLGAQSRDYIRELGGFSARALWSDVFASLSPCEDDVTPSHIEEGEMWRAVAYGLGERMAAKAALVAEANQLRTRVVALDEETNQLRDRVSAFEGSVSFRVGRAITALPRGVRDALHQSK